ncbi:hypothetical protein [Streptomyces sp. NPDC001568]|uniref:hypothetical protein n=1 Tax=Streptomyces sp. NPDC001568 TaxID=3364588 RepID=UPI0036B2F4EC
MRSGRRISGPGRPGPTPDILADANGPGAMAASLYRLPASGWQPAVAAPWTVPRALLDASAHQALVQELKWVSVGQVRAPSRPVPRAHVPTDY